MFKKNRWVNESVLQLAGLEDPVVVIQNKIRTFLLSALEHGLTGPPFDPIELARFKNINVIPDSEVHEARSYCEDEVHYIEYNPKKSRARINFSIAHELTHTFFPDFEKEIRYRSEARKKYSKDWELEIICNIGAAELLMPIGSFSNLQNENISIDNLMELRKELQVSTESLLIRFVNLATTPCLIFCASNIDDNDKGAYKIDYAIESRSCPKFYEKSFQLPDDSIIKECTAIGFTAKGDEIWKKEYGALHVECVGLPPYPGRIFPRVAGIVTFGHKVDSNSAARIKYIKGDSLSPRGSGVKIIAHVINDKAVRWGGKGFAYYLSKKYNIVYDEFNTWRTSNKENHKLGNTLLSKIDDKLYVYNMIAQHGYGPSPTPKIRYASLMKCLEQLSVEASQLRATVHMPRIGCGHAGGSWSLISEMIDIALCKKGIDVTVYDLP